MHYGGGMKALLRKRSTLLERGNRKRQSQSECVTLECRRAVYLLQASVAKSLRVYNYGTLRTQPTSEIHFSNSRKSSTPGATDGGRRSLRRTHRLDGFQAIDTSWRGAKLSAI
ncbi:hypothetical protein EVAR_96084_1 [Eumeta japonica]|uniref:Uncharacterized protein n=1 Tax=Eumeta variegata TaxID=151549 RepID=A0A4C1VCG1_EUMVA|nr:hypothetical protein EVAR_96084_1 [Eumeta japonica]